MSKWNSRHRKDPGSLCRKASGFFVIALILCLAAFLLPEEANADSGGYVTPSYDVNVVTDENHVFHVSEEIHVDFYEYRHGIYRYIPDGDRYYGVRNVRVQGYNYDVYSESGNTVVQIGDPDYTVYGPQTYRISYDVVGYRDDAETEDYLSLDLLPTGWSTQIESASLRIEFPKPIDNIETFSGIYGDETAGDYFDISSKGNVYTAVSKQVIPRGVGLTIQATLPEGYWVDPYSRDSTLPVIYEILAVMGMLMLLLWLFIGRDDPVIQTVEFYPPEEMDPLEIAYVGNDDVRTKDISALFMYLAHKGYLEIREDGKKSFSLIKKAKIDGAERHHTREIFNTLFAGRRMEVDLRHLPDSFGETAAKTPSDVKSSMEKRHQSFSAASKAGRALGLAFCLLIPLTAAGAYSWLTFGSGGSIMGLVMALVMFVSMLTLVGKTDAFRTRKRPVRIIIGFLIYLAAALAEASMIVADYPLLAGIFLCSAIASAVATIFVRRRMNNELFGRVLGFREFIRTAEYDRLKMLSEEDPEYYFNIMPYACVFGMATKWADKFSDFRIPPPAWYHSSSGVWDPYFGHHMYIYTGNSIGSAVASHYRAIGSDILSSAVDSGGGGGGFSGGGFSGGGFGGGGGGSW